MVCEILQNTYFKKKLLKKNLLKWSVLRGNRSGRTAFQYIIDLAIKKNIKI